MALVWEYNQGRDPRWKVLGEQTAGGACFALSVQFIICTGTGVSFTNWLKPPALKAEGGLTGEQGVGLAFHKKLAERLLAQHEMANLVVTRMAEQRRRIAEAGEHMGAAEKYRYAVELVTANTPLRPRLGEEGLAFNKLPLKRRRSVAEAQAAALASESGLKYISIASMSGVASSGHGIAGIVHGGQYGLFDPNYGIFSSRNEADFAQDLRTLLETEYEQRHQWVITDLNFATFA
jgi:hypothetical protein